jgi:hypothetical protein
MVWRVFEFLSASKQEIQLPVISYTAGFFPLSAYPLPTNWVFLPTAPGQTKKRRHRLVYSHPLQLVDPPLSSHHPP